MPETIAQLMRNSFERARMYGYDADYYAYAQKHPEANFWDTQPQNNNGGKVSIPDGVRAAVNASQVSDARRTLGNRRPEQINYGEFNPQELGNQPQRKGGNNV